MKKFAENYKVIFNDRPLNVLEIGSRDGDDANYLKEYFNIPNNKVYLVEPNPPQAIKIRLKYPEYKVFEYAISQSVGVLKFNAITCDNDIYVGQSSLLKRKEYRHNYEKEKLKEWENWINVLSISGKILLELIGDDEFDLVKIDVEGATYPVIKSFGEDIKKIKYIHLEAEQITLWEGQVTYDKIYEYMIKMGFKELYKIGDYPAQCDTVWYQK